MDQIYLTDPAELFDLDMDGHGFLAISDRDTSVMLIDCARMARIWRLDDAYRKRRKAMEAKARAVPRSWGPLAPVWNSRDTEYARGRSKVLHYTTIHTQPWQPFPEYFVYQFNSVGEVWMNLERSADAAGFQLFTFHRPSRSYLASVARLRRGEDVAPRRGGADGLAELLAAAQVDSVLEYSLGGRSGAADAAYGIRRVTRYDPVASEGPDPLQGRFDAVVCRGGLEVLSDDDVSWVVEELFAYARSVVYAEVCRHRPARVRRMRAGRATRRGGTPCSNGPGPAIRRSTGGSLCAARRSAAATAAGACPARPTSGSCSTRRPATRSSRWAWRSASAGPSPSSGCASTR